jgi:hypothetical protein
LPRHKCSVLCVWLHSSKPPVPSDQALIPQSFWYFCIRPHLLQAQLLGAQLIKGQVQSPQPRRGKRRIPSKTKTLSWIWQLFQGITFVGFFVFVFSFW